VRKEDLAAVRRELKNYEVMKMLMDRWIDLATNYPTSAWPTSAPDPNRELGSCPVLYPSLR